MTQMLQHQLNQLSDPMFGDLTSVQSVSQNPVVILPHFTVKLQGE
jgi:hypothetical protein